MTMPDVVTEVKIPGYLVGKALKSGMGSVLSECDVKFVSFRKSETVREDIEQEEQAHAKEDRSETVAAIVTSTEASEAVEQPEKVEHQAWDGKRRMVKFRCPECGRLNFKVCEDSGEFVCYGCGQKYNFSSDELSKVVLNCPECSGTQYFWMPEREGMALSSDTCRNCGHDIAFSYSNEERQYVNF